MLSSCCCADGWDSWARPPSDNSIWPMIRLVGTHLAQARLIACSLSACTRRATHSVLYCVARFPQEGAVIARGCFAL